MSAILIIVGFILLILGILGLGVMRSLVLFKMPKWRALVEIILGVVILIIGFISL
jgi:hypothetical protein